VRSASSFQLLARRIFTHTFISGSEFSSRPSVPMIV
jgi:hypothetical protein